MNPLSGFMQASTGSASGLGDTSANVGKNVAGLSENDDTILLVDDHARSFLAWVQNFMNHSATVAADGESVSDCQASDLDPELPAIEHLQALIAQAMQQSSTDGDVSQTTDAQRVEDRHVPLPQGIIDAIIADRECHPFSDTPTARLALSDVPEMMVEPENTPAVGQPQAAANDPILQPPVTAVLSQAGPSDADRVKTNTPAACQTQAAKEPLFQTATSGVPTPAAQTDGRPMKDHQLDWMMKENTGGEGPEKQTMPALRKPVAADVDNEQTHINRLTQERSSSGEGIAEKANRPATHPVHPIAGPTKDQDAKVTGLADQPAVFSEDYPSNFKRQGQPHPTQRVALAEINEDEWQKSQSSDSVKGALHEQTRSQPAFQETVKGAAGDPSTNLAIKPTPVQAAALTQTNDAAAKTFQTTVMDQIVDKAAMRSIHGRSEIQIRLKPEFLGHVQMNIAADKEQLVVRIMTDQPMVKEIIETHLHQLRTELQNQGLTIDRFDVMVNPDADQQHSRDQFAQMFKQHSNQNGRRQPQGQDPDTLHRDGGNHPDTDQPNRDGVNYFA
jgi:flagellar hook-length control protein FliK